MPRNAAATPYSAQCGDQHPHVRRERHDHDRQPGQQPAADHGRPATDGVDELAGRGEGDGLGDGGAGERDPGPRVVLRCSTSTTSTGTRADRTPNEVQPWARLVRQAAWKRGSREHGPQRHGRRRRRPQPTVDPRPRQEQQTDRAGDRQRGGVEEEGRGDGDERRAARRWPDRSSHRSGNRPGRSPRPGRASAAPHWSSSSVMADTVNIAEPMPPTPRSSEQLRVAVGDSGQAAAEPATMKMPVASTTSARRSRRSADRRTGCTASRIRANTEITAPTSSVADPEATSEDRQHRHQHPEADGHAEGDQTEDQDIPRQRGTLAQPTADGCGEGHRPSVQDGPWTRGVHTGRYR